MMIMRAARQRPLCLTVCLVALGILGGCQANKTSQVEVAALHEGDALESYSQEITSPTHDFQVKAGGDYMLKITTKNTGTQPWFGRATKAPVDASYRWLDGKGTILPIEGNRALLTRSVVNAGESDQLELKVTAPATPGTYTLWVSMVQEGVDWFFRKGAKPLVISVSVQ
jgi:hypothetical protein